ncbi:MAG: ABC transporter substrate-binding protein [Blastocatellia bacterium]
MRITLDRRAFVRSLAVFACSHPLAVAVLPQQPIKRIGFLIGDAPTLISAFEQELQRLRYLPGKNIVIEKRISRPNTSDLNDHAAELSKMVLDLVMAAALPQAIAMRRANSNMPMVIGTCPGMVSNGFAKSLKRPGGIYTGMDELPAGVTARRLRLLKTAAPNIKRIALLSTTPGVGGHEMQVADAEHAARSLKVTVRPYKATSRAELETALAAAMEDGMEGFVNFQGGLSLTHREMIVTFAAKHRLPAIYQSQFFVDVGGLMSWAPDQEEQFRMAARYVAKILRGAKPGDLPVHFPERYYLTIDRNAAKQMGLKLPNSLLKKADKLIG